MILPALFHWAPSDRRESIRVEGLRPYSLTAVHMGTEDGKTLTFPYLCFSPTPSGAWSLSGDMEWVAEVEAWDLYQVRLAEGDEVTYRGDFGPVLREIRVKNVIPADRVWYVATRTCPCAREVEV